MERSEGSSTREWSEGNGQGFPLTCTPPGECVRCGSGDFVISPSFFSSSFFVSMYYIPFGSLALFFIGVCVLCVCLRACVCVCVSVEFGSYRGK